jgi:hypothetical protein
VADSSGAVDLGNLSPEEKEAVEQMAEEHPEVAEGSYPGDKNPQDNKRKVLTAFSVVVGYDGNPDVVAYTGDDLLLQSDPTADLIYATCATIQKDMHAFDTAQAAAQMTASFMAQQARAMQEQMQQAQIAATLQQTGLKR